MARIAGVDLPRDKKVEIGLTYIYGIGRARGAEIIAEGGHRCRRCAFAISPTRTSTRSAA